MVVRESRSSGRRVPRFAVAGDFGLKVEDNELPTVIGRRGVLAVTHPFESTASVEEAARVRAVRALYPDARFASSFEMLRRPGALLAGLMG